MIEDWVSLIINRYVAGTVLYGVSQSYSVASKKKKVTADTFGTTNFFK
jgi:hypothetical protein